jgi:hypothetical protein
VRSATTLSALDNVRSYFQSIANILDDTKAASKVFPNLTDSGSVREDILKDFLYRHLPKRCDVVKGGVIFDSLGNQSKQIDLIVTHDVTLRFSQFEKSFNCVEGSLCAISVKTNLDRTGIRDSLENLASIPQMPVLGDKLSLLLSPKSVEFFQQLPVPIVFGYQGSHKETLLANLNEFYADPSFANIPQDRRPKLIIVNNQFVIHRVGPEGAQTNTGQYVEPNSWFVSQGKNLGAYSLMLLLSTIQKGAGLTSQLYLDFEEYMGKMDFI